MGPAAPGFSGQKLSRNRSLSVSLDVNYFVMALLLIDSRDFTGLRSACPVLRPRRVPRKRIGAAYRVPLPHLLCRTRCLAGHHISLAFYPHAQELTVDATWSVRPMSAGLFIRANFHTVHQAGHPRQAHGVRT